MLLSTFGTPFLNSEIQRDQNGCTYLSVLECTVWFQSSSTYPDFSGKFRLNKMEKDCGGVPQDIFFSMFIFESLDVFNLFMQRFKDLFLFKV